MNDDALKELAEQGTKIMMIHDFIADYASRHEVKPMILATVCRMLSEEIINELIEGDRGGDGMPPLSKEDHVNLIRTSMDAMGVLLHSYRDFSKSESDNIDINEVQKMKRDFISKIDPKVRKNADIFAKAMGLDVDISK